MSGIHSFFNDCINKLNIFIRQMILEQGLVIKYARVFFTVTVSTNAVNN